MSRGRDKFNKYKNAINFLANIYNLFPKNVQESIYIFHRNTPGNIGIAIRYALLKNLAKFIGENVSIQPNVYLFNLQNLSIGNNVSIHPMTYIEAYGGVNIGDDVSIAHGVTIMSVNHGYDTLDVPIKDQDIIPCPVIIENNVWIAAQVVILGNNIIKRGSIVGAGAVVTKNVLENTIVAGIPADLIKRR